MKKWLFVLLPIILFAGGYWFWSLSAVSEEELSTITLTIEDIGVQVQRPGMTLWENSVTGMELGVGWKVKTDATGRATIDFYGQGVSRLDHETEVIISQADVDQHAPSTIRVGIDVGAGRVWSRVLKLFDLESSYQVRTSSIVATVRGTSFDVTADTDGSSSVIVNESAVDVAAVSDDVFRAIPVGSMAFFSPSGTFVNEAPIAQDIRTAPWFTENVSADSAFVETQKAKRLAALKRLDGVASGSPLTGVSRLSERLRLAALPTNRRDALAERFVARRLVKYIELVDAGQVGMASREFIRLENDVRNRLQSPEGDRERRILLNALKRVSFLVEDADPDAPLYAIKQRMEKLLELLTVDHDASSLYIRMLALDTRLDEASRMIDRERWSEARTALNGVESGIENVTRDIQSVQSAFSDAERRAVRGKIAALEVRVRALSGRLDRLESMTETCRGELWFGYCFEELDTTTSTSSTVEGLMELPSVDPPDRFATDTVLQPNLPTEFTGIQLYVQPNPLDVGKKASLTVLASRVDGTTVDVSSRSTFSIQAPIGTINGPSVTAIEEGNSFITASYNDRGKIHSATNAITTKGSAQIESLILTSSAGTTIDAYKSTNITASVRYTTGYTKAVTANTVFTLLTPDAGTLSGSQFISASRAGTAVISASYTEGEKTVDQTITITIVYTAQQM